MIQDWLAVDPSSYFIQSQLYFFINMEDPMLELQIVYHIFSCSSQSKSIWNCLMATRDMPKKLVLFHVVFQPFPLCILWDHFINVQITLPIPSHQIIFNVMLVFKNLCPDLFNKVTLYNLKVLIGVTLLDPEQFEISLY